MEAVELADKFRHEGVVGIDLAEGGQEILNPPSKEDIDAFTVSNCLVVETTVSVFFCIFIVLNIPTFIFVYLFLFACV